MPLLISTVTRHVLLRLVAGVFVSCSINLAGTSLVWSAETPAETSGEVDIPLAGHSAHGEAYNEGPRQDAYLMGGTGSVHFPITTELPEAQLFFDQGVGQLHGFWFYEAERSFRRVIALDPDCATARWGLAMANLENRERARAFIQSAVDMKSLVSRREQLYIDALSEFLADEGKDKERRRAYIRALEVIIREFPEDVEAKALLAVHLWRSNKKGVPINSHQAVDSLLDQVFRVEPRHPAHHYRIHLWDHEHPEQALTSAAICGQAAPKIAHMWHMPGHIYSRCKMYREAAWQQEASARADHAYMVRDRILPDQIHNYAHNNEWLVTNLINVGRAEDALALSKNLLELPRHPAFNSFARSGKCSCQYGRERLFRVLETFEMWEAVVQLADSMYLEPTDRPKEQAKRLRLLGLAHYHLGNSDALSNCIASLEALQQTEQKAAKQADDQEEEDQESTAKHDKPWAGYLTELRGLHWLARGETDAAIEAFGQSDKIPLPRQARHHFLTGRHDEAEELLAELVTDHENEVPHLALQVDLLRRMGKDMEARQAFEKLRSLAVDADLDAPLLARLAKFAAELDWPQDWRTTPEEEPLIGERPRLDTLGPFRWTAPQAPDWSLVDAHETPLPSPMVSRRPVVLILYLGAGCLHCVEQLHQFAPHVETFAQQGIDVAAVSSESRDSLKESLQDFSAKQTFPIRLAADPQLQLFRELRAHDDFEQTPLHGTFLIDTQGAIRWHDIGHEPFQEPEFLLQEAERLLAL